MSLDITETGGELYTNGSKILTTDDVPTYTPANGSIAVRNLRTTGGSYSHFWVQDSVGELWGRSNNANSQVAFNMYPSTTATDFHRVYFPGRTGDLKQTGGIAHGPILLYGTDLWVWGYANRVFNNATAHAPEPQISATSVSEFWACDTPGYQSENSIIFIRKTDGTIWGIGYNSQGGLLTGNTTSYNTWQQVFDSAEGATISHIVVGMLYNNTNYVVYNDGTIKAAGYNGYGEFGNGNTTSTSTLTDVTRFWYNPDTHKLLNIWNCGGGYSSAAVNQKSTFMEFENLTDGRKSLKGAGFNGHSEMADGTTTTRTTPVLVIPETFDMKEIALSAGNATRGFAIDKNEQLYAWGYNGYGQCGDGTSTNINYIKNISVPFTPSKIIFHSDNAHNDNWLRTSFIKDTTNQIWSCGYGEFGQCGNGTSNATNSTFVPVQFPQNVNIVEIKRYGQDNGSSFHALSDTGDVYAWGYNGRNEINRHTTNEIWVPMLTNVGGYS